MKELTSAINQHLAAEFQACHTYLAMSIWLREKDLAGFSTYMHDKSQEERDHAARMIAYLVDNDEQVELPTIEAPERSWPSVQALFDQVYDMEIFERRQKIPSRVANLPPLFYIQGSKHVTDKKMRKQSDIMVHSSPVLPIVHA